MSRLPQPSSSRSAPKPAPAVSTTRLANPSTSSRLASPSNSRLGSPSASRILKPSTSTLSVPSSPRSRATSPTKLGKQAPSPTPSSSPTRLRTKSTPRPPASKLVEETPVPSKAPPMSLKEAIAMKRAETKKAMAASQSAVRGGDEWTGLESAVPDSAGAKEHSVDVDLGRWSVRDTIERARNSGSINLSSRTLPCIPSALFEIHLGLKPDPLQSLPDEPPLPESGRRKPANAKEAPSWFEQQDLEVLKASNNEIVELQHEISLFGSLKNVDLHHNRLSSLPESFADLSSLTILDLSHNALSSLPFHFFALPALTSLNLSHNALTSLPFSTPFSSSPKPMASVHSRPTEYFEPAIVRGDTPLPKLTTLNASSNKILATDIDTDALPKSIIRLDLSDNPLADGSAQFLAAVARLPSLEELRLKRAQVDDTHIPPDLLSATSNPFGSLRLLDLEETRVTRDAVYGAFSSAISRDLDFDVSISNSPTHNETSSRLSPMQPVTSIAIVVGKRVVREKWELEADRRAKLRSMRSAVSLRSASRAQTEDEPTPPLPVDRGPEPVKMPVAKREVVKEQWEIDAEQGLLTEGGRRRARALAAQEAQESASTTALIDDRAPSLEKGRYWEARTQTLTLPALAPPSRGTHNRGFSLAAKASAYSESTDLKLPTATFPLSLIVAQPFADTLRVLELKGRRADPSLLLPTESEGPFLPRVEELSLEGCGLADDLPVVRGEEKTREDTLTVLAKLFPSLKTLDLSYNNLTSAPLTLATLASLIVSSASHTGLRHLRLRGNRLSNLDGFQAFAKDMFIHGDEAKKAEWKLEELDVRENAIEALAGELGLLPLDVFLVDGNLFRVPARRVWEREGTKGLLTWLRSRLE
ncbi:L domain-like protein [Artomyces pyxidatus]|uniref:L domain-like protein n=1 Tax=Artomyces pyxidatus TaxID=48021 RepID=A0ACB8SSH3_9AGAM|nr:L domain-like protein [Artomyces pyxidatus]